MPFLPPNQQRQSTEGTSTEGTIGGIILQLSAKPCTRKKIQGDTKKQGPDLQNNLQQSYNNAEVTTDLR